MNGAQLLVQCLAAEDVTHVAGVPGTTIMDVLDALHEHQSIRYVTVRHEQAAAGLADGFSRTGRGPGVCIGSRGPGITNMATFIANAHDESVPLVAIVGQVASDITGRAAFEELEVGAVFEPFTKTTIEITHVDRIPELLQRAFRVATSGRPGPVVVSVPLDVLKAATDATPHPRLRFRRPGPHPEDVREAIDILNGAARPLIMLGGGVGAQAHDPALPTLARTLEAPVVTTWLRKDRFPNDHEHFLGTLGAGSFSITDRAVREADTILALGCRFSEFTTKRWSLVRPDTRIVHVDIDPNELGHIHLPALGVNSDALLFIRALLDQLDVPSQGLRDTRAAWRTQLRAAFTEVQPLRMQADESGVSMSELTGAVDTVSKREDVILVMDAPSTGTWIQRHLSITRPGSYVASAGGAMGWGLPAAMGIQLARPDQRIVCVSGDGSFWMVAADFETCVREDLPIVFVISNNFAYGNTRDRQRHAHGERYIGVFYDNPDFAEYARLFGGHGEKVTAATDLPEALERALASGRPAIVDVLHGRHAGLPNDLQPLPAR